MWLSGFAGDRPCRVDCQSTTARSAGDFGGGGEEQSTNSRLYRASGCSALYPTRTGFTPCITSA